MRDLYENGVWAIFSTLDPRVLQFKPGILLGRELCEELLDRARGRRSAAREVRGRASGERRAARDAPRPQLTEPPAHRAAGQLLERADWAARAYATYDYAAVPRIVERGRRGGPRTPPSGSPSARSARPASAWWPSTRWSRTGRARGGSSTSIVGRTRRRLRDAARRRRPQDRGGATAGRGGAGADADHQSRCDRVLQDHPGADDPQRRRGQPRTRGPSDCSADAARLLADAAVAAGAPDGIVQVVDEPSIPLMQTLMADERTDVIVATGGTAMVRAAYSSGNPALGVGPGNVPVLVDASAESPLRPDASWTARRSTIRCCAPTSRC